MFASVARESQNFNIASVFNKFMGFFGAEIVKMIKPCVQHLQLTLVDVLEQCRVLISICFIIIVC